MADTTMRPLTVAELIEALKDTCRSPRDDVIFFDAEGDTRQIYKVEQTSQPGGVVLYWE